MKWGILVSVVLGVALSAAKAAELRVLAVSPARHSTAPVTIPIKIAFDRPVDPATIDASTFRVFGRSSGTATGTYSFTEGNRVVTLTPSSSFFHGEIVLVNLSRSVLAADLSPMRAAGYAWQFTTQTKPAALVFSEIDVLSVDDGGPPQRLYGVQASDFDDDGWVDLGAVNEDTSDVRVFLNRADGTGLFHDFLPPVGVGDRPSPNEPADFDNDGIMDMCTANTSGASASVLLGRGDGTFRTHQLVSMGTGPRGIAVLDMDGDADLDLATANSGGSNVSIAFNDGSGLFGASTSFEGGGDGEYGLSSGDMNNDGIYDLIVGARTSQRIVVHLGNGDGTFTAQAPQASSGFVWMLSCADLNGDGNLDVTTANSSSNNGAVLLGRGDGTLGIPAVVTGGTFTIATDLGDLDGDGDADWMLSSYSSGQWDLWLNDGSGGFVFGQQWQPTWNSSCAVFVDFDRDGDLDLSLIDEVADEIRLEQNTGVAGDSDTDGRLDAQDCASADAQAWELPGEVRSLRLAKSSGQALVSWIAPARLGGAAIAYDTLRSQEPGGFAGGTVTCLESNDGSDTLAFDAAVPPLVYFYLVRARNACGLGSPGVASNAVPRAVRAACP